MLVHLGIFMAAASLGGWAALGSLPGGATVTPPAALALLGEARANPEEASSAENSKSPPPPDVLMLKDGARIEGVLLDISASEYVIQDGGGKRFVSKNLVVEIQRRIAKGFLVLQGKLVPPKGKRAGEEGGSQAGTKPEPEPQYDDAPEELRSQP